VRRRETFEGRIKEQHLTPAPGKSVCGRQNPDASGPSLRTSLVLAARVQLRKNHEVRQRKQPLLRLGSGRFRCPCNNTQVAGPREIMNVLHTDTRQAGYLRIRKYFLARLYSNQKGPHFCSAESFYQCDVPRRLKDTEFSCNSRSVCFWTKPIL